MTDPSDSKRARAALTADPWSDEQHRRVRLRLDAALARPDRRYLQPKTLAWGLGGLMLALTIGTAVRWRPTTPKPTPALVASSVVPLAVPSEQLGSETQRVQARFIDDSVVALERGARLDVVADGQVETRVELAAGRATFDVQKRPQRPFFVLARGVEVKVIGTRFEVEVDVSRHRVQVQVERGIVEVRPSGASEPSRLHAGERLEIAEPPETSDQLQPRPGGSAMVVSAPAAQPQPMDARRLFESASAARRSGDIPTAVRLYRSLLQQYPSDQRAGVVALELGRLNLDAQHDPVGAASAFRRAVAAAPNSGIREDASARLVQALDAMHAQDACAVEQKRYLAAFPHGVHAATVQGKCGGGG